MLTTKTPLKKTLSLLLGLCLAAAPLPMPQSGNDCLAPASHFSDDLTQAETEILKKHFPVFGEKEYLDLLWDHLTRLIAQITDHPEGFPDSEQEAQTRAAETIAALNQDFSERGLPYQYIERPILEKEEGGNVFVFLLAERTQDGSDLAIAFTSETGDLRFNEYERFLYYPVDWVLEEESFKSSPIDRVIKTPKIKKPKKKRQKGNQKGRRKGRKRTAKQKKTAPRKAEAQDETVQQETQPLTPLEQLKRFAQKLSAGLEENKKRILKEHAGLNPEGLDRIITYIRSLDELEAIELFDFKTPPPYDFFPVFIKEGKLYLHQRLSRFWKEEQLAPLFLVILRALYPREAGTVLEKVPLTVLKEQKHRFSEEVLHYQYIKREPIEQITLINTGQTLDILEVENIAHILSQYDRILFEFDVSSRFEAYTDKIERSSLAYFQTPKPTGLVSKLIPELSENPRFVSDDDAPSKEEFLLTMMEKKLSEVATNNPRSPIRVKTKEILIDIAQTLALNLISRGYKHKAVPFILHLFKSRKELPFDLINIFLRNLIDTGNYKTAFEWAMLLNDQKIRHKGDMTPHSWNQFSENYYLADHYNNSLSLDTIAVVDPPVDNLEELYTKKKISPNDTGILFIYLFDMLIASKGAMFPQIAKLMMEWEDLPADPRQEGSLGQLKLYITMAGMAELYRQENPDGKKKEWTAIKAHFLERFKYLIGRAKKSEEGHLLSNAVFTLYLAYLIQNDQEEEVFNAIEDRLPVFKKLNDEISQMMGGSGGGNKVNHLDRTGLSSLAAKLVDDYNVFDLYQTLALLKAGVEEKARETFFSFYKNQFEPDIATTLAYHELYLLPNENKAIQTLLIQILGTHAPDSDLLESEIACMFYLLYQLNVDMALELVIRGVSSGRLRESHVLPLLYRFFKNQPAELIAFYHDLLHLSRKKGLSRLEKYISLKLNYGFKPLSTTERHIMASWYIKEGRLKEAQAEIRELERAAKKKSTSAEIRSWLSTMLPEIKAEYEDAAASYAEYSQVLSFLRSGQYPAAAEKIQSLDNENHNRIKEKLKALLPVVEKLIQIAELIQTGHYTELLENPSFELTPQELALLPSETHSELAGQLEQAETSVRAAEKAGEKLYLLNDQFDDHRYIPLARIKKEVNRLREIVLKVGDLKNKDSYLEFHRTLEAKILAREETAEESRSRFETHLSKGNFTKAVEHLSKVLEHDFVINGKKVRVPAFWQTLHGMISTEHFTNVKDSHFEALRELIENMKLQLQLRSPLFASLSEDGLIDLFLDKAAEQIETAHYLWQVQKRIALLKVEEKITGALWLYEERKDSTDKKATYNKHLPLFKVKKSEELNLQTGIRVLKWDIEDPSYGPNSPEPDKKQYPVFIGDAYKIIMPHGKGKRAMDAMLTASAVEKEIFELVFPDYISAENKASVLAKVKEGKFWIQRVQATYYFEQNELLKELIARLEMSLTPVLAANRSDPLPENIFVATGGPHYSKLLRLVQDEKKSKRKKPVSLFDSLIEGDPAQWEAVQAALSPQTVPVLPLMGPGGTGKTRVILEVLKQDVRDGKKVLVTAPTHAAVDVIAAKIIQHNLSGEGEPVPFVRLGANKDRMGASIDNGILKAELETNWEQRKTTLRDSLKKKTPLVVLGTATGYKEMVFRKEFSRAGGFKWNRIIVDEAGKMAKPELLVLLRLLDPYGQLIIAGDPEQLPPHQIDHSIVKEIEQSTGIKKYSGIAIKNIFSNENRLEHQRSFLEWIEEEGLLPVYRLTRARRGVPVLTGLAKAVTYQKERQLIPRDDGAPLEATETDALEVIAYSGSTFERRDMETKSLYNEQEISEALARFFQFYKEKTSGGEYKYEAEDILFISPYKAQLERYDAALRAASIYLSVLKGENSVESVWESLAGEINFLRGFEASHMLSKNPSITEIESLLEKIPSLSFLFEIRRAPLKEGRAPSPEELKQINTSYTPLEQNGQPAEATTAESSSSTIHKIQGGQRKVILFSAVRSNKDGSIGFFAGKEGPAFITVAITRPEEKLVVIFDKNTFNNPARQAASPFARRVSNMFRNIETFYKFWRESHSNGPYGESWRTIFSDLTPFEEAV